MEHHYDKFLESSVNWDRTHLMLGTYSVERKNLLRSIFDRVYAISKTKEKKEGETWDALLLQCVLYAYEAEVLPAFDVKTLNDPHKDYKGFLLDNSQLEHFVDHFIGSYRTFLPAYSKCIMTMFKDPQWAYDVKPDVEFAYWYAKNYETMYSNGNYLKEFAERQESAKQRSQPTAA